MQAKGSRGFHQGGEAHAFPKWQGSLPTQGGKSSVVPNEAQAGASPEFPLERKFRCCHRGGARLSKRRRAPNVPQRTEAVALTKGRTPRHSKRGGSPCVPKGADTPTFMKGRARVSVHRAGGSCPPFLVSRVDLPCLAAAAASKQASKQQARYNAREMGKNQNSAVVLWIRVKFCRMIPMGVKYNHTKIEQETRRWQPGTGFATGRPHFQKLQFRAKSSHFGAKKALEHTQNGKTKGNGGYTPRAA